MKSEGTSLPDYAKVESENGQNVTHPETEIKDTVASPGEKSIYHTNEKVKSLEPLSKPISFEESKSQEIISHLKTVMTVSILCLILVGSLYFLELRVRWVEQILGMFP